MNIKRLRRHWDALGRSDPLWANLTNDDKRGGKWDADGFFLTGEHEIQEVMDHVGSLSMAFEHDRALDFGCGVGRLTQALATRFNDVWGVDIAPSMIEVANRYNRHPGTCHYFLNDGSDLERFDDASFDFIYSNIVLQHMQPKDQRRYLAELIRVLAPGGLFVFQLPSAPLPLPEPKGGWQRLRRRIKSITPSPVLVPYRRVRRELAGLGRGPRMEMWGQPEEEVRRYLASHGARVISVTPDLMAFGWSGFRYVVTR
jgi:ubiquinone/menaquinone biosynthesis C-methylase UbiE